MVVLDEVVTCGVCGQPLLVRVVDGRQTVDSAAVLRDHRQCLRTAAIPAQREAVE